MQSAMYPPEAIQPMRDELTAVGFEHLMTPEDVDRAVQGTKGTVFCMINSICRCAAGRARPSVARALQNKLIPNRMVTVFAGMERDAVDRVRQLHAKQAPPSSPSMCLFKDGKLAVMIQRSDIETRSPQELAQLLVSAFDTHCTRTGPSIPPEQFAKLNNVKSCGSAIPRLEN